MLPRRGLTFLVIDIEAVVYRCLAKKYNLRRNCVIDEGSEIGRNSVVSTAICRGEDRSRKLVEITAALIAK